MYIDITPNDDRWYNLKDLPNEHWKDIKDYEGLYQISDYGRVKSLERFNRRNIMVKEKNLRAGKNSEHYYIVVLSKNGKHETKKVHRLVAEAFIPNPENKPEVNHIKPVTKNKCINRIDNLEWNTSKENSQHSMKLNRNVNPPVMKGKANPYSKQLKQYDLKGNLIKIWDCINDCTNYFGFCNATLRKYSILKLPLKGYYFEYIEKRGDEHAGDNI